MKRERTPMGASEEAKEDVKPLCRAYHWTGSGRLQDIEFGGNKIVTTPEGFGTNPPGLWPNTDLKGLDVPSFTYAFIDSPLPQEWRRYPWLVTQLFMRFNHPRPVLLSFDVFPEDNASVFDYGIVLPHMRSGYTKEAEDAIRAYYDSVIPLTKYKGGFKLPELAIPRHIPWERIKVDQADTATKRFLSRQSMRI